MRREEETIRPYNNIRIAESDKNDFIDLFLKIMNFKWTEKSDLLNRQKIKVMRQAIKWTIKFGPIKDHESHLAFRNKLIEDKIVTTGQALSTIKRELKLAKWISAPDKKSFIVPTDIIKSVKKGYICVSLRVDNDKVKVVYEPEKLLQTQS